MFKALKYNNLNILTIDWLIVLLLVIIVNMRPAILGQKLGSIYFLILLFTGTVFLFWQQKFRISRLKSNYIYIYLIIVLYVLFQVAFNSLVDFKGAVSTLVYLSIGFISIIFIDREIIRQFAKILIAICVLFGLSYIVTYIIFFLVKDVPTTMNVNLATHTDYVYELNIKFPFSPVYDGSAKILGLDIPRAIGFMREPGLYQMIIIIAFWLQDYFRFKYDVLTKVVLLFSLIVTFSTAGYGLFIGSVFLKLFKEMKKDNLKYLLLGLPLVIMALYFIVFSESQFGLMQKFDSQSGASRLEATLTSLELIQTHPFLGIGFHVSPNGLEIGINYLGTLAQLGIVGSVIFMLPFIYSWYIIKNGPVHFINIYFVTVLTMLLAQPIYDKPIVYLILAILIILANRKAFLFTKRFKVITANVS